MSPEKPRSALTNRPLGVAQLSLLEHALCPLDPRASLSPGSAFRATHEYTTPGGERRTARSVVASSGGMSANDELYLWGLLGLTLRCGSADGRLVATPHYCLRQLGLVDSGSRRGGRQYRQFTEALDRISAVSYRSDGFYDPRRKEHRRVAFGLLSYSLPLDPESSRAWRFAWDPVFLDAVSARGGCLWFDLDAYRALDPATRRLYLLLHKVFARRATSPRMTLVELAVGLLGVSPGMAVRNMRRRVRRCLARLELEGCIQPETIESPWLRADVRGRESVLVQRAAGWRAPRPEPEGPVESPLDEPLRLLGLSPPAIRRLVGRYPLGLVEKWADITLAAKERFGDGHFRRSAAAFLVHHVQEEAAGRLGPPDWWYRVRDGDRKPRAPDNGAGSLSGSVLRRVRSTLERRRSAEATAVQQKPSDEFSDR